MINFVNVLYFNIIKLYVAISFNDVHGGNFLDSNYHDDDHDDDHGNDRSRHDDHNRDRDCHHELDYQRPMQKCTPKTQTKSVKRDFLEEITKLFTSLNI